MKVFDLSKIGTDDFRHRWAREEGGFIVPISSCLSHPPHECGCISTAHVLAIEPSDGVAPCSPTLFPLTDEELVRQARSFLSGTLLKIREDSSVKSKVRASANKARQAVLKEEDLFITPSVEEMGKFAYAKTPEQKFDVKRRIRAKFGRVLKRVTDLKPGELSELQTALFPRLWPCAYAPKGSVKILYGKDVIKAYENGPHSCMSNGKFLHLYVDNPKIVGLAVYSSTKDWIKAPEARALVWSFKHKGKEMKLLDRIYPNQGTINAKLKEWGKREGYLLRSSDGMDFHGIVGQGGSAPSRIELEMKWPSTGMFPYMDTLRYVKKAEHGKKVTLVSRRPSSPIAVLTDQYGGPFRNWKDCACCGEFKALSNSVLRPNGRTEEICATCFNDKVKRCSLCSNNHYKEDMLQLPDGRGMACHKSLKGNGFVVCDGCGGVENEKDSRKVETEETLCRGCVKSRGVFECHECSLYFQDGTEFGARKYCHSCLDEVSFVCEECDARLPIKFSSPSGTCVDCAGGEEEQVTEDVFFPTSLFK